MWQEWSWVLNMIVHPWLTVVSLLESLSPWLRQTILRAYLSGLAPAGGILLIIQVIRMVVDHRKGGARSRGGGNPRAEESSSSSLASHSSVTPVQLRDEDCRQISRWTRSLQEGYLRRLEVEHEFIPSRFRRLLQSLDRSSPEGAAMAASVEGILINRIPGGLAEKEAGLSPESRRECSRAWNEVKEYLSGMLGGALERYDPERFLRGLRAEEGETMVSFISRFKQMRESAARPIQEELAVEILLPKLAPEIVAGLSQKFSVENLTVEIIRKEAVRHSNMQAALYRGLRGGGSTDPVTDHSAPRASGGLSGPKPVAEYAFRGRCYACHEMGHTAKECTTEAGRRWRDQERGRRMARRRGRRIAPMQDRGRPRPHMTVNRLEPDPGTSDESESAYPTAVIGGDPEGQLQVKIRIGHTEAAMVERRALVDTGAMVSVIPDSEIKRQSWPLDDTKVRQLVAFDGTVSSSIGEAMLIVHLGPRIVSVPFQVVKGADICSRGKLILGMDLLTRLGAQIDCARQKIALGQGAVVHCNRVAANRVGKTVADFQRGNGVLRDQSPPSEKSQGMLPDTSN